MVKEVDSNNFEEKVLKVKTPVLVEIYQKACPPCKFVTNELVSLDCRLPMDTKIVKIDYAAIDSKERTELAKFISQLKIALGTLETPALAIIKDGDILSVDDKSRRHSDKIFAWVQESLDSQPG